MADNTVYLNGSYVKDTDVTQALGHLDSSTFLQAEQLDRFRDEK